VPKLPENPLKIEQDSNLNAKESPKKLRSSQLKSKLKLLKSMKKKELELLKLELTKPHLNPRELRKPLLFKRKLMKMLTKLMKVTLKKN